MTYAAIEQPCSVRFWRLAGGLRTCGERSTRDRRQPFPAGCDLRCTVHRAASTMHDTAFQIGTLAMNIYADLQSAAILEVGSQAVNGSLRDNALPTARYVGVDIEEGDGVDLVVKPGGPLPVDDGSFDLVMASSVFEHDPCFWMTFLEMCRTAKNGGYIYINAPSNGFVHRFPQDNWRFYPDSGRALAQWAISQGQHVTLVESFVAERDNDVWNDFVAVFRKGRITKTLPKVFVHEHVRCSNVITWKSKEIINRRDAPEDMVLLAEAAKQRDLLAEQAAQLTVRLAEAEEASQRQRAEWDSLQGQLAEADKLHNDLASRESELRQRQEEIEQTRSELGQARLECNEIRARLIGSEVRVAELAASENQLSTDLTNARAAVGASEAKLSERYQELAALTNLLRQQELQCEATLEHLEWLVALHERIRTQPRWWNVMPRSWRRGREHRRLQRTGLFDGKIYLKRYPDVADAGIDALDHYLRHGIHEGRSRAF